MSRCTTLDDFHDQPIPPDYYYLINDEDEYDNNVSGTPVENVLPD